MAKKPSFDIAHEPSAASVLRVRLDEFLGRNDAVVRGAVVYAGNPERPFCELAQRRLDSVEAIWNQPFASGYVISNACRHQGRMQTFTAPVVELHAGIPGLSVLLGLGSANSWALVMQRFMNQARAFLSTPAVRSSVLHELLTGAEHASGVSSFEITQLSALSRIDIEPGGRSRKERVWTRESVSEALDLTAERSLSLRGVGFEYVLQHKDHITRHRGGVRANSTFEAKGEYTWMERRFISKLVEEAKASIGLLDNRARTSKNSFAPSPLQITYQGTPFADRTEFERLRVSLAAMKGTATSVHHANPYFRGTVVDYVDGSSYEVMVLSLNRILVVPQLRASFSSIARLMDAIIVNFGDGDVADYAPEGLSA